MRNNQDATQIFIIEFGPHAQVVVPWLLVSRKISNSKLKVFVPDQVIPPLENHLETNDLQANIYSINQVIPEIKSNSKTSRIKLIITSAPESRVSLSTMIVILYLARHSCDILCIRSPQAWFHETRGEMGLPRVTSWKARYLKVITLSHLCFFAEKLLLLRSKKIVFEHQEMKNYFLSRSRKSKLKETLVFSGRLEHSVGEQKHISEFANEEGRLDSSVGIGILGTLNSERREYGPLLLAVQSLEKQGVEARIYFLGGYVGTDSEYIRTLFGKFVEFGPTKESPYVHDHQMLFLMSKINLLIAPLSKDWGYSAGKSTGAIADAIYFRKPLLMPSFFGYVFQYEWLSLYSNSKELQELIKNHKSLSLPKSDISTYELQSFLGKV